MEVTEAVQAVELAVEKFLQTETVKSIVMETAVDMLKLIQELGLAQADITILASAKITHKTTMKMLYKVIIHNQQHKLNTRKFQ